MIDAFSRRAGRQRHPSFSLLIFIALRHGSVVHLNGANLGMHFMKF